MQAAGTITNGISKILAEHLLIFNTPPCQLPIFSSTFVNCSSSPMSLATTATALPHAYLGQGQGIIFLPATCSKNTRIAVITIIKQRVTMGFPCPAYKARCPMTTQPPRQTGKLPWRKLAQYPPQKALSWERCTKYFFTLQTCVFFAEFTAIYSHPPLTFATHTVFHS